LLKNEESLPEILTLLPKVIRSANEQRLTLYHCVPVETLGVHIGYCRFCCFWALRMSSFSNDITHIHTHQTVRHCSARSLYLFHKFITGLDCETH